MWGFWWNWPIYHSEPIDWDPRDVFVGGSRGWGKHIKSEWATYPPTHTHQLTNSTANPHPYPTLCCWHWGLEMLTHGLESSPRNPRNPPEKKLGGRVRWSLGMHSEDSVTYLLAELSEPCLSQPLPPRPVRLTSPPTFPSVLFFNLPQFSSFPRPSPPILLLSSY